MDILDMLLDSNNNDPITLTDSDGNLMYFEQVAVIPMDFPNGNRSLFCVLKPLSKIKGVGDDEAIVFRVDFEDDGETVLRVEDDEKISATVFEKYLGLLEEHIKKQ